MRVIRRVAANGKRFFAASLLILATAFIAPTVIGALRLPDNITLPADNAAKLSAGGFLTASVNYAAADRAPAEDAAEVFAGAQRIARNIVIDGSTVTAGAGESAEVTLAAFGLPLKTVNVDFSAPISVVPCGVTAGVTFSTEGVYVLGGGAVTSVDGRMKRPAEGILKSGDIIIEADGKKLNNKEELIAIVAKKKDGGAIKLKIRRDGKEEDVSVTPSFSRDDNGYRLGVWLRDSTQGIGTITYYNPADESYGALGHGILDVDTKKLMAVKEGSIYASNVVSVRKGEKGAPGELIGTQGRSAKIGDIAENTPHGIYGHITNKAAVSGELMPVAPQSQVHEGPARILANVYGNKSEYYDVFIESVSKFAQDNSKGIVLRVTDPKLLERTNGIVQGMSGSPVIQDGRVIGAVTHVFVNNPRKGYGIFIEHMFGSQEQSLR